MNGEHGNALKVDSLSQEEQAYVWAYVSGKDPIDACIEIFPDCKNAEDALRKRIHLSLVPQVREAIDELLELQEQANFQRLRAMRKDAVEILRKYMAGEGVTPTQVKAARIILACAEPREGQDGIDDFNQGV